jgi:hypothetical protein
MSICTGSAKAGAAAKLVAITNVKTPIILLSLNIYSLFLYSLIWSH